MAKDEIKKEIFAPFISIVTVVYNSELLIEKTIKSVLDQTYKNIQYIIVDGKSTDGTLKIIDSYRAHIDKFISEKDNGIYDAMNKGISLSEGDYILFLNSGDVLYSNNTIEQVFQTGPHGDVYYGETEIVNEQGVSQGGRRLRTPDKLNWKSLRMGMCVSHQSFIAKKAIVPFYDLKYKISSDIDWVIQILRQSNKVVNTHLIISKFLTGGKSRQNTFLALKERFKIMTNYYGLLPVILNHIVISIKFVTFVIWHRKIN